MNNTTRNKTFGLLFITLITITLILLGFSPGLAASTAPAVQSIPGKQVILRADPQFFPARVAPPKAAELGIQTATINVTYNGFTPQAQAAFQHAVDIWESLINSNVTIHVTASWTPLPSNVLGSAGPDFFFRNFTNAPLSNRWYPVALANSLAGTDLDPGFSDITANFNSNFNSWYLGTDGNPNFGQYDFVSVVLHELGHGLGFIGSMDVNGGSGSWGLSGSPFIFDQFAENGANQQLINTGLFPNPSAALAGQLTGNNIFFDGTTTRLANGGNPAKLYAPNPWEEGSSFSHLDEIFNGTPNALMTYSLSNGESTHNPGPVTLCMFQDTGWGLSSNCAPSTLQLTKQVLGLNHAPGDPVTFTLAIQNNGSSTVTNVVVTDTLSVNIQSPSWTASASLGAAPRGGTTYVWDLNNLASGAAGVITVTGQINPALPADFAIVNSASIGSAQTGPNSSSSVAIIGGTRIYLPAILRSN